MATRKKSVSTNMTNTTQAQTPSPAKWTAQAPAPAQASATAAAPAPAQASATAAAPAQAQAQAQAPAAAPAQAQAPAAPKPRDYFNQMEATGLADRPEAPKGSELPTLLTSILTRKRAHDTAGDRNFRLWLFNLLKSWNVKVDLIEAGCIRAELGTSLTIFSSHVDTCHGREESEADERQHLAYDPVMGHIMLAKDYEVKSDKGVVRVQQKSECLGADDGVGVWIMLEMIKAQVPGCYIFHTGEERGGIGSRAVAAARSDWLKTFKRAVAFDRPSDNEVIITQGSVKCASETAGIYLIEQLEKHGLNYCLSERGTFTDTRVYAPYVPECFNLGVGYQSQHGPNEDLDVVHAMALCAAALTIDWEGMPTARVPTGIPDVKRKVGGYITKDCSRNGFGFDSGSGFGDDLFYDDAPMPKQSGKSAKSAKVAKFTGSYPEQKGSPFRSIAHDLDKRFSKPEVSDTAEEVAVTLEEMSSWRAEDFQACVDLEFLPELLMALHIQHKRDRAEIATLNTLLGL